MNNGADFINELFGQFTGDDGKEYRCTKCKYPMEVIMAQTMLKEPRKLFYCKRNTCDRFGFVTVVAKVNKKTI